MDDLIELKNQLSRQALFEAFKKQLAKDFEQSNFPSAFVDTVSPDYDRLINAIAAQLELGMNRADTHLASLLYRIDISEAQLKKYLDDQRGEAPARVIAQLIVKRVLQKVVIRAFYKGS